LSGGPRVAVVGGGYAGMAAATELAAASVSVTVFESGTVLGGRARRIEAHGHALDNGQHILAGAYASLLEMMRTVGAPQDSLLRCPLELRYAGGFALRAARLPAPFDTLLGLLGARGSGLGERFGAIGFMRALQRAGFALDPDRSVAELLAEHRQDGQLGRFLWRPLCVSALNTPPESASANAFLAVLRDTLAGGSGASDLLYPKTDLSRLFPEPAADFVRAHGGEVRLRANVRGLARESERWSVSGEAFDAVVLACGPHQLEPFAALLGSPLTHSYQPIYTCYLQYPEDRTLSRPMLGLADGLVQWVFDRGLLLGARGQLACVISAQGDHQQMTHEELAQTCHRELAAVLPDLPQPAWSQVVAEKRATIACTPNRPKAGQSNIARGLYLAGDYTDPEYPPTLEAAVRSGRRAAQAILSAYSG
jgi:squalene-associated FAD-dependent desaturase